MRALFFSLLLIVVSSGCSSDVEDAIDIIDGPERKPIDRSILGTNAFVNDTRFGSIASQFREVRDTLKISYVRILFAWNDDVQSSPSANPNFSFYDSILDEMPAGMEALVVITGIPSWMADSNNWPSGDPRSAFVDRWVRPVVTRYGSNPKIVGWEIWNEPNIPADPDTATMEIRNSPENYVEMLARAYSVAKDLAPTKLVLNGATTAINQNFPETRDYNRAMRDAGALNFTDKWNIHYYGQQFENVLREGGIRDFLNGLGKGVWVTESGAQGVGNQLKYAEETWPFLRERIPSIERIYQYQFTESTPSNVTYGLRNLSGDTPTSDLYNYLAEN